VTRAVIPELFVEAFGPYVYHVIGVSETIKGVLAFMTCPLVGRISDRVGRKACLFVTVAGTTMPVWLLAFTLDMRVYAAAQGEREEAGGARAWQRNCTCVRVRETCGARAPGKATAANMPGCAPTTPV
jgi:MFS family permease